jgi:hypothetical protein
VDPHIRWSTLQLHLRTARAARDAGDHGRASASVEAALLIDPDFLAARMLRDSLDAHRATPRVEPVETVERPVAPENAPPADFTSSEKYASFEARVKQRRIDQRIGAARTAIAARHFEEATAALQELIELDPALPASREVAAEFVAAMAAKRRRRLVLVVGVAWAVAGAVLGALVGRLPQWSPEALLADRFDRDAAYLTSRALLPYYSEFVRIPSPVPLRIAGPADSPVTEAAPDAPEVRGFDSAPESRAATTPVERPSVAAEQPMAAGQATMIRETLERYRRAYSGLDAPLVHAVYPGVDEMALARAFEEMRSQSLQFDSCTLDAQDDSARAVCRGSIRYVPAAGSSTPRTERRVWTFRLSKNTGDWTITSAWTNR